jgi:hypothetical protein
MTDTTTKSNNEIEELNAKLKLLESKHPSEIAEIDELIKLPDEEPEDNKIQKEKKPRKKPYGPPSEKQLEALKKGQTRMAEIRKKQREDAIERKEREKEELERKIVEKAILLKRKQLKKIKVLEELSDEETTKDKEIQKQKQRPPVIVIPPNPYDTFKQKFNIR